MNGIDIRLTTTVQKGGCAAKVAAAELRDILGRLRFPAAPPELLVDGRHFDDAAVYKVSDEMALVQTLDFFTPIVDTPEVFGRIAAANALSDVYAMGGRPRTCMAILAFPIATFSNEIVARILQGACDVIAQAGASLVGGHSIDDDTLKFGLSVTGFVHPLRVWANTGAQPGDRLILTKALGTGTLTAALKRGLVDESGIRTALDSMCRLNNIIDGLSTQQALAVHSATDITGFGLSGHATQMAKASGVSLQIRSEDLPVFSQAQETLAQGCLTKAHRTNAEYTHDQLQVGEIPDWHHKILHDPQTSGGLLLAVAAESTEAILTAILPFAPEARIVGQVVERKEKALVIN